MTDDLATAANRLVEALKAENAALTALDLPRAGQMLAEKIAAARAFTESQDLNEKRSLTEIEAFSDVVALDRSVPSDMRALAIRLREEAAENRRLLERAIAVQMRVLGTLAQAATAANPASRYGRRGAMMASPSGAWALSSQA
jgi:hypothetical protein